MKKITQVKIKSKTQTHATESMSTTSSVVVAGLKRLGFSETAQVVAAATQAAEAVKQSNRNVQEDASTAVAASDTFVSVGSDVGEAISLDSSSVYTPRDLKRLTRIARACIEDGKSVVAAKQLLKAIATYREQTTDCDNEA